MINVRRSVPPVIVRGNWKHLRIIQQTTEQNTGKARHEEPAEHSRTAHCALLRKILI